MKAGQLQPVRSEGPATAGEGHYEALYLPPPLASPPLLPLIAPAQVRVANWELEPFVFYAMRKVVLLVGVREHFNQVGRPS
jgi:hypothetical protein